MFTNASIFPKKLREGGMTGQEAYQEVVESAAKDEAELKITQINFNSAENSLRRRHRSRDSREQAA